MEIASKKICDLYISANEIREDVLDMLKYAGSGHLGGSFSEAEILSTLFNHEMTFNSSKPDWKKRDRFVLSKGHCCPGLYSILAQKGYFSKDEFRNLRKINGLLQGHPERIVPGVEYIAGFLGQGLSAGCGMALGLKKLGQKNKIYVLIGDGDNLEGQTWEAARFAVHNKLDNLTAIFDYNNILSDGTTDTVLSIQNPEQQWAAFGWNVLVVNGHDILQIIDALNLAKQTTEIPTMIIAKTSKGHGVTLWENSPKSHGSWGPTDEEYVLAKNELKKTKENILSKKFFHHDKISQIKPMIYLNKSNKNNLNHTVVGADFSNYEFKIGQLISLRNAFGMAASNLAKCYDDFDIFDADVKSGTMTKIFESHFPNRFIQCGIAEQNMVSAAAGYYLATKRIPIVTTYAVFTSLLTAAQFRNGVAMQKLPYIIASSHVGLDVGPDGPTHQAIEDLAIFSTYPEVQILSPCDANRLESALEAALNSGKPCYMRTGRSPVPIIYPKEKYDIGKDFVLSDGNDVSIFATGIMVHKALEAKNQLKKEEIDAEVIDITTINPLDEETILKSVKKTNCAVTAEDHNIRNGLGSAISHLLSEKYPILVRHIGVKQYAESGSPEELAKKYQIDTIDIVNASKDLIKSK